MTQNKSKEMTSEKQTNSMAIILTLSLGTLVGCMNMSMFNIALPALMEYFNTSISTVQWLVSGYMLAAGVITPTAGFLGDRFGYRKTFGVSVLGVAVLSVVGVFSWCIEALIVIRILFGLTAGLLMPLTMAMLYQLIPRTGQVKAAGIWGTANIVGGALPTALSGVIISLASWHFLLLFSLPLAILLLYCIVKYIPESAVQTETKLDSVGFCLTSVGSFLLLLAFSNLSAWGFSSRFLIITVIGLVLLGIYIRKSWNKEYAVLNLNVLRYPRYVAAILADGMNIVALYMITFVMPLFLQQGLQYSAMATGAIMLPCSLMTALAMPIATKVLNRQGEKTLALTGILLLLAGSSVFFRVILPMPILLIVVALCIRSFGMGFMNLLTTNTSMAAVPPELSGHASALANWIRQMVGALVTSIASNIVGFRLLSSNAQTLEAISQVYISSTSLLMVISCVMLLMIIPVALKYFRGKKDMQQ